MSPKRGLRGTIERVMARARAKRASTRAWRAFRDHTERCSVCQKLSYCVKASERIEAMRAADARLTEILLDHAWQRSGGQP